MPPKHVPKKLKIIKGTLNTTKELKNQMQLPTLSQIPGCPIELSRLERGVSMWNDQTIDLFNLGMLHITDLQQLMAYCVEMCLYWDCQDVIFENGSTYETKDREGNVLQVVPVPQIRMSNQHLANARALAKEFGFTPSSRAGISLPGKSGSDDPMEELLEKYK